MTVPRPRYYPTVMSGAVLRWAFGTKIGTHRDIHSGGVVDDLSAEVSASDERVMFHGTVDVRSQADLDGLIDTLRAAMSAHQRMKDAGHNHAHDIAKALAAPAQEPQPEETS